MRLILLLIIQCCLVLSAYANPVLTESKLWCLFLNQRVLSHHSDPDIIKAGEDLKNQKVFDAHKPEVKIEAWIQSLEKMYQDKTKTTDFAILLENKYIKPNIIEKSDIPEGYYNNQQRLARERGHGDDPVDKDGLYEIVKRDQYASLKNWIDYLSSQDTSHYPMWAKIWVLESLGKLGKYSKEDGKFARRRKGEVAPFAELNREALAEVMDIIEHKILGTKKEISEFYQPLMNDETSFARLYGMALRKNTISLDGLKETEGVWVKYEKGSHCNPLVKSLEGKGTNWCTAAPGTAEKHLTGGDFHVFYTKDANGEFKQPRVAIRMEGDSIGEIRGIGKDQHLDSEIAESDVITKKMQDFGDKGKVYEKKTQDMKFLTLIEKKNLKGEDLTKDELRFLYEIDSPIQGFGYKKDPRIAEIIATRNIKKDLVLATGFKESEISLTQKEAISGGIKYHYGDLDLSSLTSANGLKLPESIRGNLYLSSLTSADGLKLPETVGGDLNLRSLNSADGLKLPESIGGYLNLSGLKSTDGLKLPQSVGGDLYLQGLTSADGLKLPESFGGNLNLSGLTSANGLKLPESVGGDLYLSGLTSANGLKLPQSVGGDLYLQGLTSADGLKLPESFGGYLDLSGLTSANRLKLPKKVKGRIILPDHLKLIYF